MSESGFKRIQELLKAFYPPKGSEQLEPMAQLVSVLLVEVEALRQTLAEVAPDKYLENYKKAVYLSHNSAGPVGPLEKILRLYFDTEEPRASLILKRLGAKTEDIKTFATSCEEAEEFT